MNSINENISWINYVRVICMFFVFFLHTEYRADFYFAGGTFDVFFTPFYVNAFFIVSGYLLFRKQERICLSLESTKVWFSKYGVIFLLNILFKLIIPSILFAMFFFFPKIIIRHQMIEYSALLQQTIGGGAMWFISALVVAQFLIFILLYFQKFSLVLWCGYGICLLLLAFFLHVCGYNNFPWYYQSGMSAVFYLSFGAFFTKIEKCRLFQKKYFMAFLLVCYLLFVYNINPLINLTHMNINIQGVLLSLMSSLILISFCKIIRPNKFIETIGKQTIGIYFLSGAVPEIVSKLVKSFLRFDNCIFFFVVCFSFVLSVVLNKLLLKYAGFMFDLRKLFK